MASYANQLGRALPKTPQPTPTASVAETVLEARDALLVLETRLQNAHGELGVLISSIQLALSSPPSSLLQSQVLQLVESAQGAVSLYTGRTNSLVGKKRGRKPNTVFRASSEDEAGPTKKRKKVETKGATESSSSLKPHPNNHYCSSCSVSHSPAWRLHADPKAPSRGKRIYCLSCSMRLVRKGRTNVWDASSNVPLEYADAKKGSKDEEAFELDGTASIEKKEKRKQRSRDTKKGEVKKGEVDWCLPKWNGDDWQEWEGISVLFETAAWFLDD